MKAVILAGGMGTRISEETQVRPKPMVEIGGKPILWHIMKLYSYYGINDFVICLGYKGYMIKEYFANYFLHQSDITFNMKENQMHVHSNHCEPWIVTLVDTGENTMTGGRIKKVREYVGEGTFCLTYGDGIGNININKLISFHKKQKTYATLTAVQPPGRFGSLDFEKNLITKFCEKPIGDGSWINGGFFVLENNVFDLIKDASTIWEREPLEELANMGHLSAYKHTGFWQPLDTLRDKIRLEEIWSSGRIPWKLW